MATTGASPLVPGSAEEAEAVLAALDRLGRYIPDLGEKFEYHGLCRAPYHVSHHFVVRGYLRPVSHGRRVGPDSCPLAYCSRDQARYVSGSGVWGVIARLADIRMIGRSVWSAERLEDERDLVRRLEGVRVF